MSSARFETEKFSGKNDFDLWRIKMKALLVQQGLAEAIKEEKSFASTVSEERKSEILEKAHSAIILCLTDKVLREVSKETSAAGVWAKLEQLYMTKSFANRLYMKQRLFSYKFSEEKGIGEQLEDFNKSLDDLENIDVKLEDEDKAIILLNALPKSFEHLKDAMLYGRESTISLDEVQSDLKAKELQRFSESKLETHGEGLNVKNFKPMKGKKKGAPAKKSEQSKGKEADHKETRKCHYCKKPGHLKKDCFLWKKKQAEKEKSQQNTADCTEDFGEAEMLNVVDRHMENTWIMDQDAVFTCAPIKNGLKI